ncbi:proteoglycan 4-like [Sinocyclocheilus grahami]|uniref:proteoglycan 4-like n=1 Tax=Sinocyclocheilus grahami TaxID=75366 RepID=UPI0007AD3D61|nr:PREDICTED: proteoglycan 4-like [Sinocyclocheilus grahami]
MGSSRLILLFYLYHSWSEVLCTPTERVSHVSDWSNAGQLLQKHKGPAEHDNSPFPQKPSSSAHVKSSFSISLRKPTALLENSIWQSSVKKAHPKEPSFSFGSEKSRSLCVKKPSFSLPSEKSSSKPSAPKQLSYFRPSEKSGSKPERPKAPTEHQSKLKTPSSPFPVKSILFSKVSSKPKKPGALMVLTFSHPSKKSSSKPDKPIAPMQLSYFRPSEKSGSKPERPNVPTEHRSNLEIQRSPRPVKSRIHFSKISSKPKKPEVLKGHIFLLPSENFSSKPEKSSSHMQQHSKPETPSSLLPVKSSVFLKISSKPLKTSALLKPSSSLPSDKSSSLPTGKHSSKPEQPSAPKKPSSSLSTEEPSSKPEQPSAPMEPSFSFPTSCSHGTQFLPPH